MKAQRGEQTDHPVRHTFADLGKRTVFGRTGFDAGRDIEAITVNRWAHGYSYEYTDLYDPDWEVGQAPHELGRKPLGRISIANADSEGSAYLHAAIDAAWRAVEERLRNEMESAA